MVGRGTHSGAESGEEGVIGVICIFVLVLEVVEWQASEPQLCINENKQTYMCCSFACSFSENNAVLMTLFRYDQMPCCSDMTFQNSLF